MAIAISCNACGKDYRVSDSLAGRRVKCKVCLNAIVVPKPVDDEVEDEGFDRSIGGSPILRHEPRMRDFQAVTGDNESSEKIEAHIEQHIGTIDSVFHELVSDLVHIDIHQVAPTEQKPYWTLITSGMSDLPMTTPEGVDVPRYAELLISLPPTWPLDQAAFKDENHYWPLRWLKLLARLPHEYETWLDWGHTIPNGDPTSPFASNTQLCSAMILDPVLVPDEFRNLTIHQDKVISFFSFVPIYQEEVDFKLKRGSTPLIERLANEGVNELLITDRKNVCKRGLWPR
jgi:predicted Zn finger-like uncharacterized protein